MKTKEFLETKMVSLERSIRRLEDNLKSKSPEYEGSIREIWKEELGRCMEELQLAKEILGGLE